MIDFTERAPTKPALIRFLEIGRIYRVKKKKKMAKSHFRLGKSRNSIVKISFTLQYHRDS